MLSIYLICVVFSVALCFWYFLVDVRRSIVQNIMLLVLAVANLGYLFQFLATDRTGLLFSVRIIYIGGCFLPILFFMTVCEMCHFKLKSPLPAILVGIQTALFAATCTIGYCGLFYKSAEYVQENGVGHLIKEYGPLHILHPITLYAYMIASLTIGIYTCIARKKIGRRSIILMLFASSFASLSYIIQKSMHLQYDFTPIIYIVMITSVIIPIYRSDLFDVVNNEVVIKKQLSQIGFLTFDTKMRFMGGNSYAGNLAGELRNAAIGDRLEHIPAEFGATIDKVRIFLEEQSNSRSFCRVEGETLKIKGRTFETSIHSLQNHSRRCIGAVLEIRDITEHTRMLELTSRYNEQLETEVEEKTSQIRSIQEKTILGMAQMVESRDLSTGGHIKRTSAVVEIFSRKLLEADIGLSKHFLRLVVRSAPMHDLGKIGVDDAILRKQGRFTDEEYEKMKMHSEIGGKMVTDILSDVEERDFVKVAFNVANFHHEKVNGTGYPLGLTGDEIPIEARIMALADVFDALVSKRCYKDSFSYDKAFSIIEQDAGSHFDAKLAPIFLSCRQELEDYYNSTDH